METDLHSCNKSGGSVYGRRDHRSGRPVRRCPRVQTRRPVVVYHDGEDTVCSFVRLETVGRGGALLICDEPVPIGDLVDLAICLAGGVIRTRARVLYHLPGETGCGVGVEFVGLSGDAAELLDHLVTSGAGRNGDEEPVPLA